MIRRGTARRLGLRWATGGVISSGRTYVGCSEYGRELLCQPISVIGEPRLWWRLSLDPRLFIEAS